MGDVFDDEAEEPTVTIGEYIDSVEAEELEADLVLGGDDGKECTYANGYMKRQAIFSCLTCVPDGRAGVCTACSLACHEGHEVMELWTKRKFRCDCGNSKFSGRLCKLSPNKDPENMDNSYNHNFLGIYCTCGRPYPDPDADEQVEMLQCCICEDWFHEDHLGLKSIEEMPKDEEGEPIYEDFICQKCSISCHFLKLYPSSIWAVTNQRNTEKAFGINNDVLEHGFLSPSHTEKTGNDIVNGCCVGSASNESENQSTMTRSPKVHECKEETIPNKSAENACNTGSDLKCKLGVDINAIPVASEELPMFLSKNWRVMLCKCKTCCNYYAEKGISYLIDNGDPISEYENIAQQKREKKLQQQKGAELNFFNSLNHVQKVEILSGIADMKNELTTFLASRDSSKPVTSDDVKELFDNLAKKKKPRFS